MKKGFTLVELIAVISILGILILIGTSIVLKSQGNSKRELSHIEITGIKQSANTLKIDLNDYKSDIYNCKEGSWIEPYCEKEDGKWTKVSLSIPSLREHGYLTDKTKKWDGTIVLENNNDEDPVSITNEHTHTWGEWTITKEATTETEGEKIHTCQTCNTTETTTIPKLYLEPVNLVTKLLNLSNPTSITNFTSGNTSEMYSFNHPATSQTEALTDYRFIGNNPNNYIRFNDELWRIIGIFTVEGSDGTKEQRIKIINSKPLGYITATQDQSTDSSKHTNEWPGNYLDEVLNDNYYFNKGLEEKDRYYSKGSLDVAKSGLNSTARKMVEKTKYYLGGTKSSGSGANESMEYLDYYSLERGNYFANALRSKNYYQYVGLMYPSDYHYTFAYNVDTTCFNNAYICNTSNPSSSWLYHLNQHQWTITPSNNATAVKDGFLTVLSDGSIQGRSSTSFMEAYPVVYLKSNLLTNRGNGSISDPYELMNN